jgi:hypothetical protein
LLDNGHFDGRNFATKINKNKNKFQTEATFSLLFVLYLTNIIMLAQTLFSESQFISSITKN